MREARDHYDAIAASGRTRGLGSRRNIALRKKIRPKIFISTWLNPANQDRGARSHFSGSCLTERRSRSCGFREDLDREAAASGQFGRDGGQFTTRTVVTFLVASRSANGPAGGNTAVHHPKETPGCPAAGAFGGQLPLSTMVSPSELRNYKPAFARARRRGPRSDISGSDTPEVDPARFTT